MLVSLATIVLAIVFSFRAYYASEELKLNPVIAENIRITGILIATVLALTILGVIVSFFMFGTMAIRSPKNVLGSSILFTGLALIIGIIMIVALVYAWISYTNAINTPVAVDVLIAAIAITVAIFSPFFSRQGIQSVPVLGENIFVRTNVYPETTTEKVNLT